jgi:hypothetical protein
MKNSNSAAALTANPMPSRALQHAPQSAARADRLGASGELAEKQHGLRLERNVAAGRRQHPHRGVGVRGMPAGELRVVVELIVRVPAEDDVAESEVLVECRQELVAAQILSPQDPVGVEDADLDVFDAALDQKVADFGVLLHG